MAIRIGLSLLNLGRMMIGTVADVTAPSRTGIATNAAGTKIIVSYNEALDGTSVPSLGDFTLAGPVLSTLTGTPAVVGSTLELSVTPAINTADTGITLSYTSGVNPIRDAAGNNSASFATQAVTNSSTHAYDPRDENAGAALWVDLLDATAFTESGGVLTGLTNKIGGGAQTLVGSPAYQATGLVSKPTMDLNGTTQYVLGTDAAAVSAGVNQAARSIFIVGSFDVVARLEVMFCWGHSGTATARTYSLGQTNGLGGRVQAVSRNDAAGVATLNGGTAVDTAAHVFSFVSPGTTAAGWIDGVVDFASGALDPGTTTANRYSIGSRPDSAPDNFFDGQISEVWVFTTALSSAARVRVQNYLKAKWGTP